MTEFKRYQPRRSAPAFPWRKWLVWAVIVVVLFLIGKAIFSHGGSKKRATTNRNQVDIALVNDNTNASDLPLNGNSNANTNSAPVVSESWANFSVSSCSGTIGTVTTTKKYVALTFDLAAANDQAKQLIGYLQQQKIPASFFSSGSFADTNADFVKSVASSGFSVYSRGQKTVDMTTLAKAEVVTSLTSAEENISAATGQTTKPLFRPPFGNTSTDLVATAKEQGYCAITWTVDGLDWKDGVTADQVNQRVADKLQAGAVIDLHAGYDVTQTAVTMIVAKLKTLGYTPVSLATLLQS